MQGEDERKGDTDAGEEETSLKTNNKVSQIDINNYIIIT